MSTIRIEKASITDAEKLTEIKKRTFDEEAKKWLPNQENITDYNIQPPGYSSIEMTKYMIKELNYFKVIYNKTIVGGIIVTISGKSFGRIDRIFIDPDSQGKGIGSKVIDLIEKEFPNVRAWDLETSSRQLNNHYFYEKMGYQATFKTEDEYCYIKRIETPLGIEKSVENEDISGTQYENCSMAKTECYQVTLEGSSFSNSNLMSSHINNCNLSHSKFHNINFRNTLFADLNFSNSEMALVTLDGVRFVDTSLGDEGNPITFERCDLKGSKINNSNLRNVEIQQSDITGMKINNIPVEDLLELYYHVNKK
ncbi:GNAT family N-acetyltransferase [Bacillus pseudomycoides]|uniref:GNAT family N-acetyltransferase n=1 Tax=Bacillus pseudomycoides TaxID=64104 RepID=UPI000BED9D7C|nr:GNAT family N-acetyltransferase [Bacillus pseudomycoides]PEB38789.1 GNAT family N-acetyltransferase [Bacillus pseudomycoides]PGD98364.1 GNAT family N-acetyltransferase [Bacillus pseudomycoides]PGE05609.1 GNAT family N-acetyltransferase [Bacillus pseudomycoides]PHE70994.1 GNAT family N-acetyltransferase [Bacillus pseudomycoides]PHG25817.1 GNAT family N-acetyltransferase [Bacillus pseudomycoides]